MKKNKNENRVFVSKGWGYEDWLWNNEKYCGKKLFFLKGKRLSWHYHKLKDETFYVQSGKLLVVYSMDDNLFGHKVGAARQDRILTNYRDNPRPTLDLSDWIDWRKDSIGMSVSAHFTILEPGDTFHVKPGLRHAMYGMLDTEMFEFSTQHFDEDSYRILKGN